MTQQPTPQPTRPPDRTPIVIIGAGAAGMMTAIVCARSLREAGSGARVLLVDGAKKPGTKILVAGGGRCNVTHHTVDEHQYAGSSPGAIRSVLRRFDADATVGFFGELGVQLKREGTGKLFPTTDSAHTVLNALTSELDRVGVQRLFPWRVASIERTESGFRVVSNTEEQSPIDADRVVLATGGMALPRTGSDGAGYRFARALGHSITDRVFPSLVPIVTGEGSRWITELSGIACRATLSVTTGGGRVLKSFTNDTLCTHFGLSGPGPLDVSRYFFDARADDPGTRLQINWLGETEPGGVDLYLQNLAKKSVLGGLREQIPERLVRALSERCSVDPAAPGHALNKQQRLDLVRAITATEVDVERDRGFTFAEVTAGGVALKELTTKDMRSKRCDGLWLVGEILDVDGRIGGFNFQWAWATGFIAGNAIARSILAG